MRVDDNISMAIDKYIRENRTTAKDLCKKLDISEPAFVKWRRPGKGILPRNWIVLFPLIKKYLPKERIFIDENGNEQYSSTLEGTGCNSYFQPKYIPQLVPCVSTEQLLNFPNMVQTIEQYACGLGIERIEYRPRTQGCGAGVFAFDVDVENPFVPNGALLFSSTEVRPKNGSLVICLDTNNELRFGKYQIVADKYSIDFSTERVVGLVTKIHEKIKWIFPVLYYEVVTF